MHKNRFTCFVQSKLSNRRWVISYCKCRKNWMACISSFGEAFDKDLSEALTILLVSSNESQLSSSLTTKLWQLLCPLLHNCHLLFLVSMSLCLSFYQFFSSFYFLTSLSLFSYSPVFPYVFYICAYVILCFQLFISTYIILASNSISGFSHLCPCVITSFKSFNFSVTILLITTLL